MASQQDLPLKNDIAARFLPKIVALMVYLGTLCFVFTLFLIHMTHSWENQFTTHLSVEVPVLPGTSSALMQSQVLQLLNRTPGVQQATVVPQKEMGALFHSLLGKDVNIDLFLLPLIIDVSLDKQEKVDLLSLENHLKTIAPDIQLTDHRNWQSQVSNLIRVSVLIALLITTLIFFTTLATTSFATRTSLLIHREVIEVLSLIGATRGYIAKQFQLNALKQGLFASAMGSIFAFLTFLGFTKLLENSDLPFTLHSIFFFQALCVFTLAPFFTSFLMMFSVRFAVMKALRL